MLLRAVCCFAAAAILLAVSIDGEKSARPVLLFASGLAAGAGIAQFLVAAIKEMP